MLTMDEGHPWASPHKLSKGDRIRATRDLHGGIRAGDEFVVLTPYLSTSHDVVFQDAAGGMHNWPAEALEIVESTVAQAPRRKADLSPPPLPFGWVPPSDRASRH